MSISAAFAALKLAMQAIEDQLPLLESPANAIALADGKTAVANEYRTQVEAGLRQSRADHDRAVMAADQRIAELNASHDGQARDLNDKISLLRKSHDDWAAKVRGLQDKHDQLENSIASMRSRFA